MIDRNLFAPLLKTLDRVVLGLEEDEEQEKRPEFIEVDTEEEFDVERSIN